MLCQKVCRCQQFLHLGRNVALELVAWCSRTRKRQLLFWLAWRLQGTGRASDGRLCQIFVDSRRAASALRELARKTGRLQQARIRAHTSTQTRRRAGRQHNMQQGLARGRAQTRALLRSSAKVNSKTRLSAQSSMPLPRLGTQQRKGFARFVDCGT